jgi:ABC-2 type transport system ATP-binding protein
MDIIRTEDLTKYYGKVRALEGLDLSVQQGEVFGYLGPNGAGKTTTIRLLLDLIRPNRGRVFLFGQEVRGHAAELKRRIGNLPGELSLWGDLTGRELLGFLAHLRNGTDWAYVDRLAQRLDLDLSRKVEDYSHGNKQKVGLVQALMNRPELLILDEPTLGLDPLIQQEFYALMDEIKAEGTTVFVSSHILPEVERICDRVAIIRQGDLIAVEEVAALKRKSLRRMEVTFAQPVPLDALDLPGVLNVSHQGDSISCYVQHNLDGVIKRLAAFTVTDLQYADVDLEQIFLTYYQKEGQPHAE